MILNNGVILILLAVFLSILLLAGKLGPRITVTEAFDIALFFEIVVVREHATEQLQSLLLESLGGLESDLFGDQTGQRVDDGAIADLRIVEGILCEPLVGVDLD